MFIKIEDDYVVEIHEVEDLNLVTDDTTGYIEVDDNHIELGDKYENGKISSVNDEMPLYIPSNKERYKSVLENLTVDTPKGVIGASNDSLLAVRNLIDIDYSGKFRMSDNNFAKVAISDLIEFKKLIIEKQLDIKSQQWAEEE